MNVNELREAAWKANEEIKRAYEDALKEIEKAAKIGRFSLKIEVPATIDEEALARRLEAAIGIKWNITHGDYGMSGAACLRVSWR